MRRPVYLVGILSLLTAHSASAQDYYRDAVLANNPLFYYSFDEVGGDTVVDQTGNGHDGTIVGNVIQRERQTVGRGVFISYDGNGSVSDGESYVEVPGIPGTDGIEEFTMEFVFNLDMTQSAFAEPQLIGPNAYQTIFSTDNTSFPDAGGEEEGGYRINWQFHGSFPFLDAAGNPTDQIPGFGWVNYTNGSGRTCPNCLGGMTNAINSDPDGGAVNDPEPQAGVGRGNFAGLNSQMLFTITLFNTEDGQEMNGYRNGELFFDNVAVPGQPPSDVVPPFGSNFFPILEEFASTINLTAPSQIGNCTSCSGDGGETDGGAAPLHIDEFSFWPTRLSDEDIEAHGQAFTFKPMTVTVNRDTGNVSIEADFGAAGAGGTPSLTLTNYAILSLGGTLDPTQWFSLEDNPNGGDFVEVVSTANELSELGPNGLELFDGASRDLGNIWVMEVND